MRSPLSSVHSYWQTLTSLRWEPYSRVCFCSDNANWVLDYEISELKKVADRLGIKQSNTLIKTLHKQAVFYPAIYMLAESKALEWGWHVGASYFHGEPGRGNETFDRRFQWLCQNHERIDRLHVSNSRFKEIICGSGIAQEKIHVIPIGIDTGIFPVQTEPSRVVARKELGVPESSVVIGSFQKDGDGWGEGITAKLIKGPDIFLCVMEQLQKKFPNLHVLLSGPARGYMKVGLERLGIPFTHTFVSDYSKMYKLYHCLDLCLVTSREEGGPKAILESMAAGIPLVTTRVGQASDLVQHGVNGWMVDVDDINGLVSCSSEALVGSRLTEEEKIIRRATAEENSYLAQEHLWRQFFTDFVDAGASQGR